MVFDLLCPALHEIPVKLHDFLLEIFAFENPPPQNFHSLRSRHKRERGRGARTREKNGVLGARDEEMPATKTHFFISAHRFLGNPIKLTVNATTNQKQVRAFLHD